MIPSERTEFLSIAEAKQAEIQARLLQQRNEVMAIQTERDERRQILYDIGHVDLTNNTNNDNSMDIVDSLAGQMQSVYINDDDTKDDIDDYAKGLQDDDDDNIDDYANQLSDDEEIFDLVAFQKSIVTESKKLKAEINNLSEQDLSARYQQYDDLIRQIHEELSVKNPEIDFTTCLTVLNHDAKLMKKKNKHLPDVYKPETAAMMSVQSPVKSPVKLNVQSPVKSPVKSNVESPVKSVRRDPNVFDQYTQQKLTVANLHQHDTSRDPLEDFLAAKVFDETSKELIREFSPVWRQQNNFNPVGLPIVVRYTISKDLRGRAALTKYHEEHDVKAISYAIDKNPRSFTDEQKNLALSILANDRVAESGSHTSSKSNMSAIASDCIQTGATSTCYNVTYDIVARWSVRAGRWMFYLVRETGELKLLTEKQEREAKCGQDKWSKEEWIKEADKQRSYR